MTLVKICGITNAGDALFCASRGADFLGFVFHQPSPRYVAPAAARRICAKLPGSVRKVGVFVDERPRAARRIAEECGLDVLQFHGRETPAYIGEFADFDVIKAMRVRGPVTRASLTGYGRVFWLFDTFRKGVPGGTGESFDWSMLAQVKKWRRNFFVSGGLTPDNVGALVVSVAPFAVDVSSGVEKSPGIKDHRLVERFINQVKR